MPSITQTQNKMTLLHQVYKNTEMETNGWNTGKRETTFISVTGSSLSKPSSYPMSEVKGITMKKKIKEREESHLEMLIWNSLQLGQVVEEKTIKTFANKLIYTTSITLFIHKS